MRILIVEDEFLSALHLEAELAELGATVVGIAVDTEQARQLAAENPQIALVDMNLRDGPTGAAIGAQLAAMGVEVFYLTANPAQIPEADRDPRRVIPKPFARSDLERMLQTARGA